MSKKRLITPIVMVVGVVLCAAARVFTISQTDMKLGSIKHESEVLCTVLYFGALLISAVLAAVFMPSSRRSCEDGAQTTLSEIRVSGGAAIAVGFGLLAVGVGAAYDAVLLEKTGMTSAIFMAVSFAFAAAFVVIAFITLYKKVITPTLGFAYSFGGIYFVLRGIFCFMSRMTVAAIPEYLIEALSAVFGGVFFVMIGKLLTGNEGKLTRNLFCAWGTGAAVLTLSAFLGTAAAKLFLSEEISQRIVFTSAQAAGYFQSVQGVDGYMLAFPAFTNIGLGIFAAATVIALSISRKNNAVSTENIQPNPEQ